MKIELIQANVQSVIDDLRALDPTSGRYNEELSATIAQLIDVREELKNLDRCECCNDLI